MEDHKLDFHGTFRRLCFFKPSMASSEDNLKAFIDSVLNLTSEPERLDRIKAQNDWSDWLKRYAARIESERDHWGADADMEREREAKSANPRFVLRQWVLEEVIKKVETDAESGKRILRKVLHVRNLHVHRVYVGVLIPLDADGVQPVRAMGCRGTGTG